MRDRYGISGAQPEAAGCGLGIALALVALAAPFGIEARAAEVKWDLELGLEERYDDNIIQLSDRQRDRVKNPSASDLSLNRFSIETPEDIVSIPQVSAAWRVNWLGGRPAVFDVDATAYEYLDNPIKDYQSYRLSASQALHRGKEHPTSLGVTYALIPSFYLRNLFSERNFEQTLSLARQEATYRKTILEANVEQWLVPDRLRFEGAWGREDRDYNSFFDERDSRMPFAEALFAWAPLGDARLRLRLAYRREHLHAEGDLIDTLGTEADISSKRRIWSGDARLRWGKKGRKKTLRLRYEAESRDYTTANPSPIGPFPVSFQFDRTDARRYATLGFQANLRKGWFLTAMAERDTNDANFATLPPGSSDPNDVSDYTENLVQAGFGYRFGFGGEKQPGAPGAPGE